MNIIQSFLHNALSIRPDALRDTLEDQFSQSAFAPSLSPKIDALLVADSRVTDDLWKVSVSLNIPHQLLFDAFVLQQRLDCLSGVTGVDD